MLIQADRGRAQLEASIKTFSSMPPGTDVRVSGQLMTAGEALGVAQAELDQLDAREAELEARRETEREQRRQQDRREREEAEAAVPAAERRLSKARAEYEVALDAALALFAPLARLHAASFALSQAQAELDRQRRGAGLEDVPAAPFTPTDADPFALALVNVLMQPHLLIAPDAHLAHERFTRGAFNPDQP
jgi:hypothetical protein